MFINDGRSSLLFVCLIWRGLLGVWWQNVATECRRWWLVNAEGHTLGRLASKLVPLLMGKHKPTYLAHVRASAVANCGISLFASFPLPTELALGKL